jgi:hypothetical protein
MIFITKKLQIDPNSIQLGSDVEMRFYAKSISGDLPIIIEYSLPEDSPVAFSHDSKTVIKFNKDDNLSTFEKSIITKTKLVSSDNPQVFPSLVTITATIKPSNSSGSPAQKTSDKVMISSFIKLINENDIQIGDQDI